MVTPTRVLIVDDDPDFIRILQYNLRLSSGRYQVESVSTFQDGLAELRQGNHAVYLIDYELDGENTADVLISEASGLMRPVIVLTSHEDDKLGDRIIGAGACDFLNKRHVIGPLLDRVVRNSLGRQRRLERILKHQQVLTRLLSRDPLTGLLSRSALKEEINKRLTTAPQHGALFYVDLDEFKPVNDQHGHDVGDEVLQMVAARLIDTLQPDDIVGRIGGDEFLIYVQLDGDLKHLPESAAHVAEKLVVSVAEPYLLLSREHETRAAVSLSASIGVAVVPTDGRDYEALAGLADRAMYRAKHQGKNDFAFHQAEASRRAV